MLYSSLLPLFLSLTHQTSRQSCLWSILPTLWLPLWSRLPSCLPWLIAVASDLVSLLLHCSPTISFLVKRSQWLSKNLTFCPALLRMSPWLHASLRAKSRSLLWPGGLWWSDLWLLQALGPASSLSYLTLLAFFLFLKVSNALRPQST